ncbi:MAG: hypothetical protein ABL914_00630 [Novosphingobium sp.]|uniref:hypothetical protein n=1 Tax=Novosphingobium sp. TaxID=1874826 RepID=UPI0032BBD536
MLTKITGLAGALATLMAIVTAFMPMEGLNVALGLLALGMIAGISIADDMMARIGIATLALPVAGAAMVAVPAVGTQLGAMLSGFGLVAAGAFGVAATIRMVTRAIATLKGLAGGASS